MHAAGRALEERQHCRLSQMLKSPSCPNCDDIVLEALLLSLAIQMWGLQPGMRTDSCRTGLHADLRRSHESGFVRKPLENEEVTEPFALSGTLSCLMLKDFRGSHTFSGGMSTAFQALCMCAADFKLQSQNSQTFLGNAFRNP